MVRSGALRTSAVLVTFALALGLGSAPAEAVDPEGSSQPGTYVVDLVSTAAFGVAMNGAGDVAGTSYRDTGCGSSCLPPQDTVVWRNGERIVLPDLPGLPGIYVKSMNAAGWVAGLAGFPGTTTHAVVWKPDGDSYTATDLGTLPGTNVSEAVGIDDLGRVIGWSTTLSWPPNGSPFLWTEAGGMVDLSAQGFPDDIPLAISPGGTVATPSSWYRLGDPESAEAVPPSPPGFYPPGSHPTAINDAGDQARFLVSTGTQNPVFLFRLNHEGTWQQLSTAGTGHLTTYGVGSITADRTVTATVVSTGVIAYGPAGLAQPLADLVAPSYQNGDVTVGGPINKSGEILVRLMIGRSVRLVRLVPGAPCTDDCARVVELKVSANGPEYCDGGEVRAKAKLTVVNESGDPLRRVRVTGHFFDDYWLDRSVVGRTDAQGQITLKHNGPPCVGAIAFLVTEATKRGLALDRTTGTLTGYVIPQR